MSKSLKRVTRVLADAGWGGEIIECGSETRTAQQAADVAGCHVDQIAKSIIFRGETSGRAILFVTAGGKQVDPARASELAGEPLGKADAALIRAQTGFAIGGVSPVGHLNETFAFFDETLMKFDVIYAAAGTPRHIFPAVPAKLQELSGGKLDAFTVA